jgi:hypothetical protein
MWWDAARSEGAGLVTVALRDVAPAGDRFGRTRPDGGDVAHPGPMAPSTTAPAPGSMTVPPLFGWQEILAVLALVIAAALAFLLIAAVCAAFTGRSEWQAFLAGRSRRSRWAPSASEPGPAGVPQRLDQER